MNFREGKPHETTSLERVLSVLLILGKLWSHPTLCPSSPNNLNATHTTCRSFNHVLRHPQTFLLIFAKVLENHQNSWECLRLESCIFTRDYSLLFCFVDNLKNNPPKLAGVEWIVQKQSIIIFWFFSEFSAMSLLGKVALVTGASSGIGAATAVQLARWETSFYRFAISSLQWFNHHIQRIDNSSPPYTFVTKTVFAESDFLYFLPYM